VTEEFGDAGEVSSILELAVGVQQVEDLVFVRQHPGHLLSDRKTRTGGPTVDPGALQKWLLR
jgi:hypothetical protein